MSTGSTNGLLSKPDILGEGGGRENVYLKIHKQTAPVSQTAPAPDGAAVTEDLCACVTGEVARVTGGCPRVPSDQLRLHFLELVQ